MKNEIWKICRLLLPLPSAPAAAACSCRCGLLLPPAFSRGVE